MIKDFASASIKADDNLSTYMRQIRTFPLLSVEEEQQLARAWITRGDVDAAHRLVTSHLRLAAKIAAGYRGYNLPMNELVSEANVGLMQAVERFDPEKGFRLATYAMWWIRAAIQEYILHSWSMVRLGTTAQQKKLFFNLRRLKGKLQAFDEGDLPAEVVTSISQTLSVPETDVIMMNRRLAGSDQSLNTPLREQSDSEWQDWLVDEADGQDSIVADREEQSYRRTLLEGAMQQLSGRERDILYERRLKEDPLTLETLAQRYGISRERVRQIEVGAMQKISRSVRNRAEAETVAAEQVARRIETRQAVRSD